MACRTIARHTRRSVVSKPKSRAAVGICLDYRSLESKMNDKLDCYLKDLDENLIYGRTSENILVAKDKDGGSSPSPLTSRRALVRMLAQ
jgi:hypothetical protein